MKILTLLFIIVYGLTGCGRKEDIRKEETPPRAAPAVITGLEQKVEVRYRYKGDVHRDPFVMPTARQMSTSLELTGEGKMPNFGALELKGILRDKQNKIALLFSPMGSYVLRNNTLYDINSRKVPGVTGKIEERSVMLTTADKFSKTYSLREIK